jgi:tRNA A22 N-methylase
MNSKLSHRLQTIHDHTPLRPHIYDVGCDHGELGLSFQIYPQVQTIHLVDPSRSVIESLIRKTSDSDIPKQVLVLQKKADQLEIKTKKNSVILCGFGGTQITEGVRHLKSQLDQESVFVLSPHRHVLQLREWLAKGEFDLLLDTMILEDQQFYPLLVLGNRQGRGVHPFGEKDLWHSPVGAQYREQLLGVLKKHQNPRDQSFSKYLESL